MAQVYLNIGSNIERHAHICAGLDALQRQFGPLQLSSVYESTALGFSGDAFFNLAVALNSTMGVAELAGWLRQLEFDKGRQPNVERFSPRTLDIDILTYEDRIGRVAGVQLPRPEILENAHVLCPLAELAPGVLHPVVGLSYAELWAEYTGAQRVWLVDFDWGGRQISKHGSPGR